VRLPHPSSWLFALAAVSLGAPRAAEATPLFRPVLEGRDLAPTGGDLGVTVSARAARSDFGSEVSGFVALAVPLDRLAAPRRLAASAVDPPKDDEVTGVAERAPADAAPSPSERPSDDADEQPALSGAVFARLARDAIRAALRAHDVMLRRAELEGVGTRARLSAALPELRLRAVSSNDQSQRLTPTIEDPERYTITGGNDLLLEAAVTWKLNRLVFADEEIALERLELERERSVDKLRERVLERLFDWHRALSRLSHEPAASKTRGRHELERLEAEVELDVLTGGWFSDAARRLPEARPKRSDYKSEDSTSSSRTSLDEHVAGASAIASRTRRARDRAAVEPATSSVGSILTQAPSRARKCAPCWPKPGTSSPTSSGASTR
jgi:hypothetical protein